MSRKKRIITIWILSVILLWGRRFLHFIVQDLPLGYDPGRYRAYFIAAGDQLPDLHFANYPAWIQKIFPPFLWMLVNIFHEFLWISLDRLVSRWVWVQSALVSLAIYFLVSAKDKRIALVAALLSWISFVQYEVFRWTYIKQLRAMFFLLIIVWLRLRKKRRLSLPLILALTILHRPGTLVFAVLALTRFLTHTRQLIRHYQKHQQRSQEYLKPLGIVSLIWLIALVSNMMLYPWFITDQVSRLFSGFLASVDIPNLANDSHRSWWTFLTISDLLKTNRHIILLSLIWLVLSFRKKWRLLVQAWVIFGYIRVFGQFAFHQRMIWYADLFWLILAAAALVWIREWKKRTGIVLGCAVFLYHGFIFSHRVERTWRPIMVSEELQFFKTLPDALPKDAVLMNTFNGYSVRLKGRWERPTISPGLFDLDQRNRTQRDENRRHSDGKTKCDALQTTYWNLYEKIYIWQGSKQPQDDFTGADCLRVWKQSDNPQIPRTMYEFDG